MTPFDCGGRALDLSRTAIMGILNVTPDSFSDGGIFLARDAAVAHALAMVEDGADLIDVGGESTRPGAQAVSVQEELDRVIPVIEAIARAVPLPVSIDTSKPEVMRAAVAAGAGLINDVRALRATGALQTAAALAVPVCLMHMQGEPRSMQHHPAYTDVAGEVRNFLQERIEACVAAGIPRQRLIVDPGFGFGKTVEHNLELLRHLDELRALGTPILAGLSRKSMIGALCGLPVEQRLHASVALALIAVQNGATMLRVHDVRATREAIRMFEAVYPRTGEGA
ncbi:MAG TPA: dihydropteroate synthase [Acidiferrobacterales bacterium]|nr:dihydropteroate synthase [Acidiferrobacterales bacterium]